MMMFLKRVKGIVSKYIDVDYFLKFFILLITLYYFNIFYIAIIDKNGRVYSSFLDNYLNYVSWVRNAVLYSANLIDHAFGIHSFVSLPYTIKTLKGSYVDMVYDCLGLGLMSFWLAFVIANKESLKRKITWCTVGIICIWFINSWRVAILLLAFEHHWKVSAIVDHHTLFNIISYSLIIFMISLYIKDSKKVIEKMKLQNSLSRL